MLQASIRFMRTVRHLRPRQVGHQLLRRIRRPKIPRFAGPLQLRGAIDARPFLLRSSCEDERTFTFLNRTQDFTSAPLNWSCPEMSRLWRYNLHYFDYLHQASRSAENIHFLLSDWIKNAPPGTPDAWDPFPISLRIVNWIKLVLRPEWPGRAEQPWLHSLYLQALWLERNLEYHLLANHFFKNAKALVFAGTFFAGPDADRWLRKGLEIVSEQLEEQILADGGHFERSPMYHSMLLEDCLDLLNLGLGVGDWKREVIAGLREKCRLMIGYLLGMSHPDGEIALFNDAAFGIEAPPAELARYFCEVTREEPVVPKGPLWSFPQTGYFIMAPEPGNRLIVDCGPIGPDYQPGHAHCDTLSFELSLKGRRLIVDSGCYHYLDDDIRSYNRGNRGHNTLTLNEANQSEIWGAHRVARRARPLAPRLEKRGEGIYFSGSHDGYSHLPGSPVHHRSIAWDGRGYLVEDRVSGRGVCKLESRFHLHPDLSAEALGRNILLRLDGAPFAEILCLDEGRLTIEQGWYCPEFGLRLDCPLVVYSCSAHLPHRSRWRIRSL